MDSSKRNPTPNTRLWIRYKGDHVRIKLVAGEQISFYTWERTEEGWNSEYELYTHHGTHICLSWASEGRDCDGHTGESGELICDITRTAARSVAHLSFGLPDWEEDESESRAFDKFAEAMGY